MKNTVKRLLAVVMVLAMVLSVSAAALAVGIPKDKASDALEAKTSASYDLSGIRNGRTFDVGAEKAAEEIAADQIVTIMVELDAAPAMEVYDQYKNAVNYSRTLQQKQAAAARTIGETLKVNVDVARNYTLLFNGFAFEGEYRLVEEINKMDGFRAFVAAEWDCPEIRLFNSGDMVGAINAWDLDYTGEGRIVAIVDTGVMVDHPAFSTMPDEDTVHFTSSDIADIIAGGQLYGNGASTMNVANVYYNAKIPFRWNYVHNDYNTAHVYNDHGTHVAGIAAGNGGEIQGVAKDAQIAAMQVFNDNGGAGWAAILSALEDCVVLGVDAANLSLGSPCGFTQYYDSSYAEVFQNLVNAGVNLSMSAGNEYSTAFGNAWAANNQSVGYALIQNPDYGVTGSPSTWPESLGIASVDNSKTQGYYIENVALGVQFSYSETDYNQPKLAETFGGQTLDYIYIPGAGNPEDFEGYDVAGKVALIQRGDISFYVKIENAQALGAIAVIIFNNTDGIINMNLQDGNITVPAVSITMDRGNELADAGEGQIYISDEVALIDAPGGGLPSDFSSWGTTSDLKIKPEITAPGGNIYSSTDPRPNMSGAYYQTWSGTSMSAPHVTGGMAIVSAYVEDMFPNATTAEKQNLVDCILMSTATPVVDSDGGLASVRKQGAGLMDLASAVTTTTYLTVEGCARPKLEIGDDPECTGVYEMTFTVNNFGEEDVSYTVEPTVLIDNAEAIAYGPDAEHPYVIATTQTSMDITDYCDIVVPEAVTVPAGGTADVTVVITLTDEIAEYLDAYYTCGAYIEGFIQLYGEGGINGDVNGDGEVNSEDALLVMRYSMNLCRLDDLAAADVNGDGNVNMADALLIMRYANGFTQDISFAGFDAGTDLNIPFLGFYGDWNAVPMFDQGFYYDDFSWGSNPIDNFIGSNFQGENYGLGINPYVETEDLSYYSSDRNAVSPNGDGFLDTADVIRIGLMRNSAVAGYQLLDGEGNFIANLARQTQVRKDYESTSTLVYSNLGQNMPMPKWGAEPYAGQDVAIRAYAYLSNDGSTTTEPATEDSFNYFGEWIIPIYVDVTAPTAEVVSFANGVLTLNVTDDHYVAFAGVFAGEVTSEGITLGETKGAEGIFEDERGAETEIVVEGVANGDLVCLGDYAGNEKVYVLQNGELVEAGDNWSAAPTQTGEVTFYGVDKRSSMHMKFDTTNLAHYENINPDYSDDITCGTYTGEYVYMVNTDKQLIRYDASDLDNWTDRTVIGTLSSSYTINEMAYNKATGKLYIVDGLAGVCEVNVNTAAVTELGSTNYGIVAMDFDDDGNCYIVDAFGYLCGFDINTCTQISEIGSYGITPYSDGSFIVQCGTIYEGFFYWLAIDVNITLYSDIHLYAIDLATGSGSDLGSVGNGRYPLGMFAVEYEPIVIEPVESSVDPVDFYENFEGAFNWELVDADEDELNWGVEYVEDGLYADGSKAAVSYSWLPEPIGAFTPDNYMISESFEIGEGEKYLSFFTSSKNTDSMYEEHLQVIIIPEGADVTEGAVVFDGNLTTAALTEHVINLGDEFAGETVRIAFRHFDCYDLYTLIVDAIGVGDLK